jgi:16S rRNA (uracil1498-N3)-methyltransferase
LVLFDGAGLIAKARVLELDRRPIYGVVNVISRDRFPAPVRKVHLASALPKGERQGFLLDLATQFGMTDFTPLKCQRSVARVGPACYRRWQRTLIETCKQSHRPWLPQLHPACTPQVLLSRWKYSEQTVILADPQGDLLGTLDSNIIMVDNLLLMVGPEGGFSTEERDGLLELGAYLVCLADVKLRIEAAAAALVAAVWSWPSVS